jgi:hypothetical protein
MPSFNIEEDGCGEKEGRKDGRKEGENSIDRGFKLELWKPSVNGGRSSEGLAKANWLRNFWELLAATY